MSKYTDLPAAIGIEKIEILLPNGNTTAPLCPTDYFDVDQCLETSTLLKDVANYTAEMAVAMGGKAQFTLTGLSYRDIATLLDAIEKEGRA